MRRSSPLITLLVIYALAILVGAWEYWGTPRRKRAEPDIYGDPKRDFPEAMSRLYPGSAEAEYLLGRRAEAGASRGYNSEEVSRDPQLLQQFVDQLDASYREAAAHYERAIALGLVSEESLYYNYALTLVRLRADPAKIDRAIEQWKRNFPFSDRRDLAERREAIEKQLRNLPLPSPLANPVADATETDAIQAALHVVPEWKPVAGYVGSDACRKCHAEQFDTYLHTSHSRALADVKPADEPADAVFDHAASGRRYRVTRRDGRLIHEESLPQEDGTEFLLTSTPVSYRVGSGNHARTYLCDAGGGFLFESPITWYESAHKWGMTPGFDKPHHRSFSRPVLGHCLGCHSGQVQTSQESHFRLHLVENAIGCERCHGPGESHVKVQTSGKTRADVPDDSIVNPRRLPRKVAEAVCQQCHLQGDIQVGGSKGRPADYRPGQPIEEFSTAYRLRNNSAGMTVVGHVEQLAESACYRQSETLTCVTCHNPHVTVAPGQRAGHFRSVCMTCHDSQGCRLTLSVREEKARNDCAQCHMPKSTTDVPHVAFTHHHIGIHPLQQDVKHVNSDELLIPLSDLSELSEHARRRSLMLARLQMFLVRDTEFQQSAPGQQVRIEIDNWLRTLKTEEVDAEVAFNRIQFLLACGDFGSAVQSAAVVLARQDISSEEEAALLDQLGKIDLRQNKFEQARVRFEKLIRLRCQGQDWFSLGMCEQQLGKSAAATLAFERAQHLEPASIGIREALRKIYHARQDPVSEKKTIDTISRLQRHVLSGATATPKTR